MSKKILTSFAAAGLLLSLVGCTSASDQARADCAVTPAGDSSGEVDVTGEAGEEPTVEFSAPLTATETERTVITEGDSDGDPAVEGSTVTVDFSAYNATTGDEIEKTGYTDEGRQRFTIDEAQLLPGLLKGLECSVAGDRLAVVIPPTDAFGEEGQEQLNVAGDDSMIFVIDVVEVSEPVEPLPKADGEDQPVEEGFPTVELAEDGTPTVTIPATEPPTELMISTLKKGDGPEVAEGDEVTVHYTGIVWGTGDVFDSSWDRGEPTSFPTNGVIPGFSEALVGATVGSQVLAVIPPAEGYGDTPPEGSPITATDTLVFIVDILATQ